MEVLDYKSSEKWIMECLRFAGVTQFDKDVFEALRIFVNNLISTILDDANAERRSDHESQRFRASTILTAYTKRFPLLFWRDARRIPLKTDTLGIIDWLTSRGFPQYAVQVRIKINGPIDKW